MNVHQLKLVVVGDGAVGKTCLLTRYATGKFPHEYVPTCFESYATDGINVDDFPRTIICLWDLPGGEDYDRLRPISYPDTDAFVLCFSIEFPSSLENILERWYPELNHHCPKTPILLVGNKIDLRNEKEKNQSMVTYDQGIAMAERIGAKKYLECSSLEDIGIKDVFDDVIRIAHTYPVATKSKKKCQLV